MAQRSSYKQGTPAWVDLQTTDVAAAQAFYGNVFGWTFDDMDAPGDSVYSRALVGSDAVAAIAPQSPMQSEHNVPPAWNTYLAVNDLDRSVKRVAMVGGTVLMPPMDIPGSGRMAFVADPTGAAVGFWEAGGHIGATLVNEPNTLIWNELVAPDKIRALNFYFMSIGVDFIDTMMGDRAYALLQIDGEDVGGAVEPLDADTPPHWHVWFAVADIDATVKAALAAGGTIVSGPETMAMGQAATIQDPQGATFSVLASA